MMNDSPSLLTQFRTKLAKHQHEDLLLTPSWYDNEVSVRIDNISPVSVNPQNISLFNITIPNNAELYLEGFQMLAQSQGKLGNIQAIGRCPDSEHYRLNQSDEFISAYGMLVYQHQQRFYLIGFSSCHRFSGLFEVYPNGKVVIAIDGEGLELAAQAYWTSEHLVVLEANNLHDLQSQFAAKIQAHHPRLTWPSQPSGWCSWYHYYADVTAADIVENLEEMEANDPELEYLLLDDGYQAFMGDWLIPSERFSDGVAQLCHQVLAKGKQPAMWLAPFIAQAESQLFQQHPDWFVTDQHGQPLAAEKVTYGGWRCTPWFVLDTSQDDVCDYLRHVFSSMYHQWGVKYFKLDALYWGTLGQGFRKDPQCTRIQAYRKGMQAILDATEGKAFILGCNASMWPSLGLVHGMRIGDDVERNLHRFQQTSKEMFARSWQHQQLWLNDPDCVTLNNIPDQACDDAAYNWHRCSLLACAGLVFSGDRLNELDTAQRTSLQTLAENNAEPAQFSDLNFQFAKQYQDKQLRRLYWFNWGESTMEVTYPLTADHWQVLWQDKQSYCEIHGQQVKLQLAAGSAMVLTCDNK